MDTDAITVLVVVIFLALLYGLPTFIAFRRQHEYRWIIFAINMVVGATGLGWLIAFVWAIYPANKSLADPVLGNPTGLAGRNVGHTLREVSTSAGQSCDQPLQTASALDALDKLALLAEKGIITPDEFEKKKASLLCHI